MRKILLGILLLFLATDLFAQSSVRRRPVFPVSGGTWYGPVQNALTGNVNNTTASMQSIEVVTGGSATKLRVYVGATQVSPSSVKLAIYNDAGTSLLGNCTAASVVDNQYNECTMGTPVSVSSATRYRCAFLPSDSMSFGQNNGNSVYGFFQGGQTYASFPPATLSATDAATEDWACGIHVE